jgi:hypothetical protein
VKTIAVIIRAEDPARIAEALRAAVGLTLRGDRVRVIAPAGAEGRAVETLRMLGHVVTTELSLDDVDAVEVWS